MKKYGTTGTLFLRGGKYMWSNQYEICIDCGTCNYKHKGRGLCTSCWDRERRYKGNRPLGRYISNYRFFLKKRVKKYLLQEKEKKRGPKKFLTMEMKKAYKKKWFQENKKILSLLRKGRNMKKNGLPVMEYRVESNTVYLPFSTLIKPSSHDNPIDSPRRIEWKENYDNYTLIINFFKNKYKRNKTSSPIV